MISRRSFLGILGAVGAAVALPSLPAVTALPRVNTPLALPRRAILKRITIFVRGRAKGSFNIDIAHPRGQKTVAAAAVPSDGATVLEFTNGVPLGAGDHILAYWNAPTKPPKFSYTLETVEEGSGYVRHEGKVTNQKAGEQNPVPRRFRQGR